VKLPLCLCVSVASVSFGAGTTAWEMNTYQDFIRGRFQGVSLSRDGRLSLAPQSETVFSSDQPIIWSVAQGPDGTLYAATGHRGRVFQIDKSGKSSVVWTADQPEVFALAVDRNGVLYAASSPDGKVYRIQNGKASEYFDPKAKYIWSLVAAPGGVLYAGTGDQGRVYRADAAGKGDLYYETGQAHVTSLSLDNQGRLLAGTEPNGILYRISGKDKAFVLYDASLPEIRAIVPMPDGTVYAAALGGSIAKRTQPLGQPAPGTGGSPAVTTPPTTITVTAEAARAAEIKPPQPEAPKPAQPPQPTPQVTTQFTPVIDLANVEKSAVYMIHPDNSVETLWSSKEENVYDLLALPGQILFSTDSNGRIYRLSPDRKVTLVLQTNEGEATRLLSAGDAILAATGNRGRIYKLSGTPGTAGSYESPVHDAGSAARWGRLSWRAEVAPAAKLAFRTRSGNSAKPDKTWSDWSEPLTDASGAVIPSPTARYIQWKTDFSGNAGASPVLTNVTLAYLPQNNAPQVKSINVVTQVAPAPAAKPATQPASAPYTVTVTDTGESGPVTSAGTPTQTLSRASSDQISITWQAEDPDGDRLVYTLYFRGEGENQWKTLKANLHENSFSFDSEALADGKYYFRVTASDREVNPPAAAREAELVSAPVMIDNTPPVVTIPATRKAGSRVELEFEAVDAASPLRRCEYSLDAAPWVPIESVDGVIDSQREKFLLRLDNLSPGEHLVVIRAVDSANNAGLAKIVLR
jgi:hypothetical protein